MGRVASRVRRWRHSLFARASIFVIVGSGFLLGAMGMLSSVIVKGSVDRLLAERIHLARTTGEFVEQRIKSEMDRLSEMLGEALGADWSDINPKTLTSALAQARRSTVFSEGVFVIDRGERLLGEFPPGAAQIREHIDLADLLRQSPRGLVSSPLVFVRRTPTLVVLMPVATTTGRALGYVAGLLEPVTTNLLSPASDAQGTQLRLVDSRGVVVASTNRANLFRAGDHGEVLANAIGRRSELRGRCHSCHSPGEDPQKRDTDVMGFAPLPSLAMGVAVLQPESEALAPAVALRKRLLVLGVTLVSLFVLFTGLSVRSVVRPVTRLTKAVRVAEATRARLLGGPFGKDEVGELATALDLWHERVVEAEQRRQYLHRVLGAQEEERRRIARELHDTVAQDLAAVRLEIERMSKHEEAGRVREQLDLLERRLGDMMITVRRILLDLRLSFTEGMGFLDALQERLERMEKENHIRTSLVVDGEEPQLEYEIAVTLFRILQEALLNVVLHSGAEQTIVSITFGKGFVEVVIEDDGCGFEPESQRHQRRQGGRGLGLLGMEERADLLGAKMSVKSAAQEGTTVSVWVPLAPGPDP